MHAETLLTAALKHSNVIKYVFRAIPGILFLFSATAKLAGIDAFELYVFSLGKFPLGTAYLLARIVIAAEYTLGILLLANFLPRLAAWGSAAMLGGFTLFLTFLLLSGRQDDCNCFGEWIRMNPAQSIGKNLVLLALLAAGSGLSAFRLRHKGLWFTLSAVIPLAAVLTVSPPDNWRYGAYDRRNPVNETALREAVEEGLLPRSLTEGEHVVCFFSLRCDYCRMSARKLMILRERGEFSQAPVIAVFGRGEDTDTGPFLEDTGFRPDQTCFLDPSVFLRITNGAMPLILVMQDSVAAAHYNYRNLH